MLSACNEPPCWLLHVKALSHLCGVHGAFLATHKANQEICIYISPVFGCTRLVAVQVPAGSLPRSMEVIVRNDAVERCRAGDTVLFVGTPIVVPDVAALTAPGERIQTRQGIVRMCLSRNMQKLLGVHCLRVFT